MKTSSNNKHISIWHDDATLPTFDSLNGDLNFDFVVIGGGISGVMLSYLLQKEGAHVALVEAKHLGSGVTGSTTAHLSYIPDILLPDLIKHFGEENARIVIGSWIHSIDFIEKLANENKINCDFKRLPGYLFTESENKVHEIEKNSKAALLLGIPATLTTDTSLPFKVKMAARFDNHAEIHPLKFIKGIVESFTNLGGKVFEESRVIKVKDGNPCIIETKNGTIKANKVVMATYTPINVNVIQTEIVPYLSYVIGARLNKEIKLNSVFWDNQTPYNYIRSYNDEKGQLIIIGGADHKIGEHREASNYFQQMETFARTHFDVKSIDYMWSGEVLESEDGLPYIGKLPSNKNVYVITGLSGNGITGGVVASMLLTDLFFELDNKLADIVVPKKRINFMHETEQSVDEYVRGYEQILTMPHSNLEDLEFEEGKIISMDEDKIAVYRDQDGQFHSFSAFCTHAGCLVKWNNIEKTWDCPCHGSRFNATGEVLEAPATVGLRPVQIDIKAESKSTKG